MCEMGIRVTFYDKSGKKPFWRYIPLNTTLRTPFHEFYRVGRSHAFCFCCETYWPHLSSTTKRAQK
jgi:hypothetical protein